MGVLIYTLTFHIYVPIWATSCITNLQATLSNVFEFPKSRKKEILCSSFGGYWNNSQAYTVQPYAILKMRKPCLCPCSTSPNALFAILYRRKNEEKFWTYNRFYLPAHLIYSIGSHELYFFSGIPWGTLVDLYLIIMNWVILDTVGMILSRFIYKSLLNIRYMVLFILMAAP